MASPGHWALAQLGFQNFAQTRKGRLQQEMANRRLINNLRQSLILAGVLRAEGKMKFLFLPSTHIAHCRCQGFNPRQMAARWMLPRTTMPPLALPVSSQRQPHPPPPCRTAGVEPDVRGAAAPAGHQQPPGGRPGRRHPPGRREGGRPGLGRRARGGGGVAL